MAVLFNRGGKAELDQYWYKQLLIVVLMVLDMKKSSTSPKHHVMSDRIFSSACVSHF